MLASARHCKQRGQSQIKLAVIPCTPLLLSACYLIRIFNIQAQRKSMNLPDPRKLIADTASLITQNQRILNVIFPENCEIGRAHV